MLPQQNLAKNLTKTGVAAGLTVSIMYPARTFLPLPELLVEWFFIFFGPIVIIAYVGIVPFLMKHRLTVPAILGTLFGVLAGSANAMFAVVQLNNLHYLQPLIDAAEDPAVRDSWHNILYGVFSVQNGLNIVADIFFDWTAICYGLFMWNHPKFGKTFSVLGFLAGGTHFVLKMTTFPTPPSEAGLFDAGPIVSIFFALVTIQVLRHLRWMDEPASSI
jgi:hypothetical protein